MAEMKKTVVHLAKVTGIHGTEKHLLTLLPALNARKHEVMFLILTEPEKPVDSYCALLQKKGVATHTLPIHHDIDTATLLKIIKFLKKMKPALVHTHLIHGDFYGITAATIASIRNIISTKHNDDAFRRSTVVKFLNSILDRRVSHIITISEWIRHFTHNVEGVPFEKMKTIYYGLPPLTPSVSRELKRNDFGFSNQETVLGITARLVEQKGHRYLIEAFSKAYKEHQSLRLVIVGEGPLKVSLKQQVKEKNLDSVIMFTGYRTDIANILQAIDIFIHPSLWEGFGLSIVEAMMMGKPVIATNVSAIPEIVENGVTGMLVQPGDITRLASTILELAASKQLQKYLGENAAQKCRERFSVEKMLLATEALYDEVLTQ